MPIRQAWVDCLDVETGRPEVVVTIEHGERYLPPDPFLPHLVLSGTSTPQILHDLSQVVTMAMLGLLKGQRLLLHAAAVSDGAGNAVAFLGPSGAGKTTLARSLAPAFGYLTDETVILDRHLEVTGYAKPLSLVEHGRFKRQVPISSLAGRVDPGPSRLCALWILDRDPRCGKASLTPVSALDALPVIAVQSSWIDVNDRPLAWLAAAARAGNGVQVARYAESADLVPLVREELGAHAG